MNTKKENGVTKEIRIKRCYGCGAILQSAKKHEPGYIAEERLALEEEQLCERCYRLRHYNEDDGVPHFNDDFASILKKAKQDDALVVYVTDAFSFEVSLIPGIKDYIGKKLLVIFNKRDVLPQSYSDEKLLKMVETRFRDEGIKPLKVLLLSTLKNYNLDAFIECLRELRQGKDIYFVGVSQVGKSSLINLFLKHYENHTDKLITTSIYPGTTIDVIQIPLDNDSYIYDTPGIFNGGSIINNVERQILKYIIPRTEIKPRIFQSNDQQSFILGNLGRIDFVEGPKTNLNFMAGERVEITRTKIEKAARTFDSFCLTKESCPISSTIHEIKDLKKTSIVAPPSGMKRIIIGGLCYMIFEAHGQKFDVYAPANVLVKMTESVIN